MCLKCFHPTERSRGCCWVRSALAVLRSLRLGAQPGTALTCPSSTAKRISALVQSILTDAAPHARQLVPPDQCLVDVGVFPTSPEPTLSPLGCDRNIGVTLASLDREQLGRVQSLQGSSDLPGEGMFEVSSSTEGFQMTFANGTWRSIRRGWSYLHQGALVWSLLPKDTASAGTLHRSHFYHVFGRDKMFPETWTQFGWMKGEGNNSNSAIT